MNKIICDICGTSYPDTADQCPICGYSRELNGDNILENAEPVAEAAEVVEETEQAAPAVVPVIPAPVIEDDDDDDDYDEDEDEDEDEDDDDEDDDEDDEPRSNTVLIVILVILIVALLGVSGFIFVRYFLPNMNIGATEAPTTAATESVATEPTTEPRIPCTGLAMVSEGLVILEEEGAEWLVNVAVTPEDTTDKLLYASSDESVVTVNEAGKVTAVGQGEAVITVTCGEQLLQCNVTCFFIEETTAPTATTAPETFPDETTVPSEPEETTAPSESKPEETKPEETTAPTEPEETTAPTEPEETTAPTTEVTLTLKKKDISFGVVPAYYTLEIVEDIDPKDVKWSSSNGSVVLVHNGQLQIVGWGTAKVYAEYKGVKAECIIRVVPMQ